MRKGITPIIAIIILLLITMALAGTAYLFLSQYMAQLTRAFQINELSDCTADGMLFIYITNMAQENIVSSDFDECLIDGISHKADITPGLIIEPGTTIRILEKTGMVPGNYEVKFSLGQIVRTTYITCP